MRARLHSTLLCILFCALPAPSFASDLDHVRFGGVGEVYVPLPIENALPDGDRLRVRNVELTAQAAFEEAPGLSAKLTLGGDDTSGDLTFNVREGFISAQIDAFVLRAGKFYLPIGLLNQTRRTAWGMITAPRSMALFFNDNGIVDTGADLAYTTETFEFRVGAANGYRFDSSVTNTGAKPLTPTHFARPALSVRLGDLQTTLATDYVARVADDGTTMRLAGVDASIAPAAKDEWAWQGQLEAYHRFSKATTLAITEELGGYLLAEKGLGPSSLLGVRLDAYKIPTLKFSNGDDRKNLAVAVSPIYTYRGHDHLRVQVAYNYLRETRDGDTTRAEQSFELRLVTEFGDLPVSRTPGMRPTLGRSSL